jgi:hypothetical protein
MMWFVPRGAFAACLFVCAAVAAAAQSASPASKPASSESVKTLEQEFFGAIRNGDAQKVLSYIPKSGVNAGPDAHHLTREEVEQQFQAHRGLYCYLFDSSCIDAAIDLGNSKRACSDRELLTHSEKVRTASSEVTRNNVQQAILVAEVKNDQCGNVGLVDFIFNLDADGWRLFSIP